MQASDRFNINSQLEHLQAKYVGTGHADLTRFEWAVNIQRDSYASYIGHYPMLAYFAIAENESIGRERYNFMQPPPLLSRCAVAAPQIHAPPARHRCSSAWINAPAPPLMLLLPVNLRMALGSLKEEHSSVVAVWLSLVADILCGCLNLI
ncbi:splicing factor 3B subunit 5 isoform X1 [Panicum hallii]|uniref:splicing factor 3B subunit 5 isoform X1 n=1 Tax=Panicum hallii TaxID=206008 RepID=UPI000DF4E18C|nr:splicing factor 3B subunit 5 isoform X1 [Panicum hallii]